MFCKRGLAKKAQKLFSETRGLFSNVPGLAACSPQNGSAAAVAGQMGPQMPTSVLYILVYISFAAVILLMRTFCADFSLHYIYG